VSLPNLQSLNWGGKGFRHDPAYALCHADPYLAVLNVKPKHADAAKHAAYAPKYGIAVTNGFVNEPHDATDALTTDDDASITDDDASITDDDASAANDTLTANDASTRTDDDVSKPR
jgi:hypothetical protein